VATGFGAADFAGVDEALATTVLDEVAELLPVERDGVGAVLAAGFADFVTAFLGADFTAAFGGAFLTEDAFAAVGFTATAFSGAFVDGAGALALAGATLGLAADLATDRAAGRGAVFFPAVAFCAAALDLFVAIAAPSVTD
jgi:hypothetical protein